MHELSVCLALIEQVQGIAIRHGDAQVLKIELAVGPLSGVEADLLRNAWPLAAAGSLAADAELNISTSGVRVRCSQCKAESDAAPNRLICGDCGDYRTNVVSGDEMILKSVELENARPAGDTAGPSSTGTSQTQQ